MSDIFKYLEKTTTPPNRDRVNVIGLTACPKKHNSLKYQRLTPLDCKDIAI